MNEAPDVAVMETRESVEPVRALSLRQNFSWTFFGNGIYAACQWGMLVLLAKASGPAAVGQFALGLAIANPVMTFVNLELRVVQATDVSRSYRFGEYLRLRLVLLPLMLLIVVVLALIFARGRTEMLIMIGLVGLAKAFESLSDVYFGLFQRRQVMDRIAKSLMLRGVLSIGLFAAFMYATGDARWAVFGMALAFAMVALLYDVRGAADLVATEDGRIRRERQYRSLVSITAPLAAVAALIQLNPNVPRYFIEFIYDEQALGIFAAIAYLSVITSTVMGALDHSAIPRLAEQFAHRHSEAFWQLMRKMMLLGLILGGGSIVVAIVAGEQLLELIYTREYTSHQNLLVWILVAGTLGHLGSSLRAGVFATRDFRALINISLATTAAMVIACAILVPWIGILGGALAFAAAMAVQVISSGWHLRRAWRRVAA
jgi:O-antigen/teichoic acid export membrane protein